MRRQNMKHRNDAKEHERDHPDVPQVQQVQLETESIKKEKIPKIKWVTTICNIKKHAAAKIAKE